MNRLIVLDAGPLGLASKSPGKPEVDHCLAWISMLINGGDRVAVPEIARYEVRRELVRIRATSGLRRLDRFQVDLVFLPIDSNVMDIASELWARVRQLGLPTAADHALDGDAILAAQAIVAESLGDEVIIATTNVAHLARFPGVVALDWRMIT